MAYERLAFNELMPHTVRISTRSGHNLHGEPTWAVAASTYRARVVEKPSFTRTVTGEVIPTRGVVYVASTGSIKAHDRLTLPDGTTPSILSVERYPDEDGTHHHKIILGH